MIAMLSPNPAIFNRRMLICIVTGFSSGLPLFIFLNLIPVWLAEANVSLKTIGLFSLLMLPYTWKFMWSPFMDRFAPPLGRRRGWMLITQLALLLSIATLGLLSPIDQFALVMIASIFLTFCSASQDVVLDAYRRELLPDEELGLGNVIHVNAYKIASLVPGSLALILADHLPWSWVFMFTAFSMLPGIIMTCLISEPIVEIKPRSLMESVIAPFQEFMSRQNIKTGVLILLFMLFYKLGDSMATALASPFYLEMGFSKTEIGLVAKSTGLLASIIGGFVGGIWMMHLGINRALWIFGVAQAIAILGFAFLAYTGNNLFILGVVIGGEAFGTGLGTAAFVAFIARTTTKEFAATQFALFTALTALPRTFANASTGYLVESFGWIVFFILCFMLALPGMLLLPKVAPWNEKIG
jgi:PAT family beta-lactamase induction signal transducer AmpG